MAADKIVALIHIYDQVDLLKNFFAWYSEIGVDYFIVQDMGSTDGTLKLLDELARQYPIEWFSLQERDLRKHRFGNTGDEMVMMAREKLDPKWLLMCDADEFLVLEHEPLHLALEKAEACGVTSVTIPCFNMTGAPLSEGDDAVASLSLRIVSPYQETYEEQVSGILPKPYIFIRHPPKSIVMAAAFTGYVAGSHGAHISFGRMGEIEGARFNHYSIRGYDKFHQKIQNTEAFLAANNHLESWWAWHWRRWIKLEHEGRLKEDYDTQFVSKDEQEELIRSGVCTLDSEVSEWAKGARQNAPLPRPQSDPSETSLKDSQVVLNEWFLCDNAFKTAGQIEVSSWIEFAPFIIWLVEVTRPQTILDIGTMGGNSSLVFCQALDFSASGGRCTSVRHGTEAKLDESQPHSVREAQLQYELSLHGHHLTVLNSGINQALMNVDAGSIDIVSIDGSCCGLLNEGTIARILQILSNCGVILVQGINNGSVESGIKGFWNDISKRHRQFELFHGNGLGVSGIGHDLPDAVSKLCALSAADARILRNVYAQLGRAVPKAHERDVLVEELRQRLEALEVQRAAFEGGCKERDEIIRNLTANLMFERERYKNLTFGPLRVGWEITTYPRPR